MFFLILMIKCMKVGSKELGVNFNSSVSLEISNPDEKSVVRLGVREGFLSKLELLGGKSG